MARVVGVNGDDRELQGWMVVRESHRVAPVGRELQGWMVEREKNARVDGSERELQG